MTHPKTPFLNFTQIPNVFFDYWMKKLSPAEFKVLMYIGRKTWGWRKNHDEISLSQMEEMTGLSRKGITKVMEKLEGFNLISRKRNQSTAGGYEPTTYEIIVHGSELSTPHTKEPRELSSLTPVNSVHIQKKDLTKEKEQQHSIQQRESQDTPLKNKVVVSPLKTRDPVTPCLENIQGLSEESARQLMAIYSEEKLKEAVEKMKSSKTPIENPSGWLYNCIKKNYKPPASPEEVTRKNKRQWEDRFKRFEDKTVAGTTIAVCNKYIEFYRGGAAGNGDYFNWDDPLCIEKVEMLLKSLISLEKEHGK
jgi:phage replication O-like protein O